MILSPFLLPKILSIFNKVFTMNKFLLLSVLSLGLTACQSTPITTKATTPTTEQQATAQNNILIVYYEQGKKATTLSAIAQLHGKMVYDYQNFNSVAVSFADVQKAKQVLAKTDGILSVIDNEVHQLH